MTDFSCKKPLRILAVSTTWQGGNNYAFVRSFRRMGHSVQVVSEDNYFPQWNTKPLKAVRRLLQPFIVAQYNEALLRAAKNLKPELFFVFKGPLVKAETLQAIKSDGAIAIQFYPDVSFRVHGPHIAQALPKYDWVFTTKTFGIKDMYEQLNFKASSFLPHAYDPETHRQVDLSDFDQKKYGCDFSFIGTWSPKKQKLIEYIVRALPKAKLKIWGGSWEKAGKSLLPFWQRGGVYGIEYAKAINASKINLGILSEIRKGASSGDQITSRTFHIPAAGGFMLHERTDEAENYFMDGKECAFYSDNDELVSKIIYYLENSSERMAIAKAGRDRCLSSGYSVDHRVNTILDKFAELQNASNLSGTKMSA